MASEFGVAESSSKKKSKLTNSELREKNDAITDEMDYGAKSAIAETYIANDGRVTDKMVHFINDFKYFIQRDFVERFLQHRKSTQVFI